MVAAKSLVYSSTRAIPKSPILTTPLLVRNTLPHLRSLCNIFFSWQCLTARSICVNKLRTTFSSIFCFLCLWSFIIWARSPPITISTCGLLTVSVVHNNTKLSCCRLVDLLEVDYAWMVQEFKNFWLTQCCSPFISRHLLNVNLLYYRETLPSHQ